MGVDDTKTFTIEGLCVVQGEAGRRVSLLSACVVEDLLTG